MSIKIRESQEQTAQSSWMPTIKTIAWGTLALGTIAAVGAICYASAFPQADAQEIAICPSQGYMQELRKEVADLCGETSPFNSLCAGNLGISRFMMPQVNSSTLELFLSEKASQGISASEEIVNPANLIPAQSEMDFPWIADIIQTWLRGAWDPCKERILSAGGYVIDGHHRWAACSFLNRDMMILNIQDSAQNVLSELANFRGVFTVQLGERI